MECPFTMDRYSKVAELFDLPMCIDIMQVFVYDCLLMDSFQEKNRKDDNYIVFSRGSSELQQRALLVLTLNKKSSRFLIKHLSHFCSAFIQFLLHYL